MRPNVSEEPRGLVQEERETKAAKSRISDPDEDRLFQVIQ
jgi:hypothetical protein